MVPVESLYLPPPRGSQLETKGMALELPLAQEGFQTWEGGRVAFSRTSFAATRKLEPLNVF